MVAVIAIARRTDMAQAKDAAMIGVAKTRGFHQRGMTNAGCLFALLLLATAAIARNDAPVAAAGTSAQTAPAPSASQAPPAVPPTISYVGGQLTINALDSTLGAVLTKVAALTGMKIDVPDGANSERMPIVELGPGPARQIVASLLSDSSFDYVIQSSDTDRERIQSVLLMPRAPKGSGANGTDALARAARGLEVAALAPPESPAADSPVPPAAPDANLNPAAAATQPAPIQPDQTGQFPLLQPDTTNPAKPGALTPPPTLNQSSISQQLQQMYQQRMQITQQDHYTGTQPLPAIPGVNK